MRKGVVIGGIVVALLALATVALIVIGARQSYAYSCEVCITYKGRSDCGEAYGRTKEEAQRTATDVACALISAGMTDTLRCSATPPSQMTCSP